MTMTRRNLLVAGGALAGLSLTRPVLAQDVFPKQAVKMVIPFPPGGPTDLLGRLVAQRLSEQWKQPVVSENKPGASGSTGSLSVAQAKPDGYTLVLANNASHGAYEILYPKVAPYQTLRDFTPLCMVGVSQLVMVINSQIPARNLQEFIAWVKANPGKVNYASSAYGSSPHLASELLKLVTGIDMTLVNFAGAAPAIISVAAGEVQMYMGGLSTVAPMMQEGKVRAIAAMSETRVAELPDMPTCGEQGVPGVSWDSWYGVLGPAKMPAAIADQINADIRRGLDGEEMRRQLQKYGIERKTGTRAEFEAIVHHEYERTAELVKKADIKAD